MIALERKQRRFTRILPGTGVESMKRINVDLICFLTNREG